MRSLWLVSLRQFICHSARCGVALPLALLIFGASSAQATRAYVASGSGQFGTIDLDSGAFTSLGNMGLLLSGLGVANGNLYGSAVSTGDLYQVNTSDGTLTFIGDGGIPLQVIGSTTSGLYALNFAPIVSLYSIDSSTGAASLVGSTGLSAATIVGLSTNADEPYFANGSLLYSLNPATGAATLIGSTGLGTSGAVLVFDNGTLYGGVYPSPQLITLDTTTGAATFHANVSGGLTTFYGLAPDPLPAGASVPEPATASLVCGGALGIVLIKRRCFWRVGAR